MCHEQRAQLAVGHEDTMHEDKIIHCWVYKREPEEGESDRRRSKSRGSKSSKSTNQFIFYPSFLPSELQCIWSSGSTISGNHILKVHSGLTAHSFCNMYASFLFTWFAVMYVHPHRLQEVLKDLLWCSWYHSVPAMNERRCDAFYKHTKKTQHTHTRIDLFYCAFVSACARLLTHTW